MVFACKESSSGGELYFISSAHNDLRIRANVFGNVSPSKNKKGWEVWKFVSSGRRDGSFFISPWTHSQLYLSSSLDGRVTTTRNKEEQLWKLERDQTNGTEHMVLIRSLEHGRYLQLEGGQLSTVTSSLVSNKCLWNLESANLDTYFLHCLGSNMQLGCPKSIEAALFSTKKFDDSAVWIIQKLEQDSDNLSICSKARKWYLRSTPDCDQVTLSMESGAGGWQLTPHQESNGTMIINAPFGGTLVCSQHGRIMLDDDHEATQSNSTHWKLVPVMPDTTTLQQLGVIVGTTFATLLLGIAAPYTVVGIFHAIGFTAHGIEAGSIGAHQMSRVAKAHGGTIPPGCLVSILQSIGVLGLDTTWFLFAMSVGSLMSAVFFRAILCFSGILKRKRDPCTSGIVPLFDMEGILSTLDDSVHRPMGDVEVDELDMLSPLAQNPGARPLEIEVDHRNNNHPVEALSIDSRFADASSASRASRSAEGQAT